MSDASPFEMRAGMQLMPSMLLRETNIESIRAALSVTVAKAPALFRGALVAVDLQPLHECDADLDFLALAEAMREVGMVPAGVRNGGGRQQAAAREAGWAILPERREVSARGSEPSEKEAGRGPARIVSQPVRSGQQVYAPSDLVLLAPVSAGAEVLADGCIHVYGPLRGRALAGIRGDEAARIFCQALYAELVSVAGHYRILDDLDPGLKGKPAQIYLDGEQLIIEAM